MGPVKWLLLFLRLQDLPSDPEDDLVWTRGNVHGDGLVEVARSYLIGEQYLYLAVLSRFCRFSRPFHLRAAARYDHLCMTIATLVLFLYLNMQVCDPPLSANFPKSCTLFSKVSVLSTTTLWPCAAAEEMTPIGSV